MKVIGIPGHMKLEPRSQVLSKDIMMVITPWDLGSSVFQRETRVSNGGKPVGYNNYT